MKKWLCSVAGLSFALAGSLAAHAQTPAVPPPNILNVETNNIKPYRMVPTTKLLRNTLPCRSNSTTRRTSWRWRP